MSPTPNQPQPEPSANDAVAVSVEAGEGGWRDGLKLMAGVVGIFLALMGVYWVALGGDLVFDSRAVIGDDIRLREFSWGNFWLIWTEGYWWPTSVDSLFRPLTTMSYWVNYSLMGFGENGTGYKVVNLGLHAMNAVLVAWLARQWGLVERYAWLAAAGFALHPVTVEAVINIVGRADLLAGFFVLAGYGAAMRYGETGKRGWLLALGGCGLLAVLAKESGIVLAGLIFIRPVVGLLRKGEGVGRWEEEGRVVAKSLMALAPAIAFTMAVRLHFGVYGSGAGEVFLDNPLTGAGAWGARVTALAVVWAGLVDWVWPTGWMPDYSFPAIPVWGLNATAGEAGWMVLKALGVVAVFGGTLWGARRAPAVTAAALFFAVTLSPVSNLLILIGSIRADRFLYLPSVGLALAAGWGVAWVGGWVGRKWRENRMMSGPGLWLPVVAGLFFLGAQSQARGFSWQTELGLWVEARERGTTSFKAAANLAFSMSKTSERLEDLILAVELTEYALRRVEEAEGLGALPSASLYTDAGVHHLNLAEGIERVGGGGEMVAGLRERGLWLLGEAVKYEEALIARVERGLLGKGEARARLNRVGNPKIFRQAGFAYLDYGASEEAYDLLLRALRLDPLEKKVNEQLAEAARRAGRYEETAHFLLRRLIMEPLNLEVAGVLERFFAEAFAEEVAGGGQALMVEGRLNIDHPVVRLRFDQAVVSLADDLAGIGLGPLARRLVRTAVEQYGLSARSFPEELR